MWKKFVIKIIKMLKSDWLNKNIYPIKQIAKHYNYFSNFRSI